MYKFFVKSSQIVEENNDDHGNGVTIEEIE